MEPLAMKDFFIGLQKELYNGKGVVNFTYAPHFNAPVGQVIEHVDHISKILE
jgi:hypothetical protein